MSAPDSLPFLPNAVVTAHQRELSDHCPVSLISEVRDDGPSTFKIFNSWIFADGIKQVVRDSWSGFRGFGLPDSYLAAKLRFLKSNIRKWRQETHQKESVDMETAMARVADLEKATESRSLSSQEQQDYLAGMHKIA